MISYELMKQKRITQKTMKKNILYIMSFAVLSAFTSCTADYKDFNTNPYDATHEELERDGYNVNASLTNLAGWVIPMDVNAFQFNDCLLGGSYGGYLADSNNGFNGKNFAQLNPEEHWSQAMFNDVIPKIFENYNHIQAVTKDPITVSVARIMKVMALLRVTDTYGAIPYSKVGEDAKITAPYDSEKDIYTKMFSELDESIEALTPHKTIDFNGDADWVYQGKVEKWIKLANSIKLRMAIRISNVEPELAKKMAESAVSNTIGVITKNADNAFATCPANNPLRVVMYEYNKGDSRVSADITSYMTGYKDPRCDAYFTKSTFSNNSINGFVGLRSGIDIPSGESIKQYSNAKVESKDKLMWMNAAEVAFLRAEGALRGWNMNGTAKQLYEEGIRLSFEQHGVKGANEYLNNSENTPALYKDPVSPVFSFAGNPATITIKWKDNAEFEENLERIITQKWIANFPLGVEAWAEYRRTGYPHLMPTLKNNSGGIVSSFRGARRLAYPQRERTDNTAHYKDAVANFLGGLDNMATDLWWAKKN